MERLLPPEEVAEILAVPVRTLYAWRAAGTGPPAVRCGKYLRWDPVALKQWLDSRAGQKAS